MKFLKLTLAATVAFSGIAHGAAPTAKPNVDPTYVPYEKVGILAKLPSGQSIHIKCMGNGSPTVILTAGMGGWSADWRKVQPQIARTTRVCAWDRPGFGFSSGSAQPQTVARTTSDLEAALKVAHIGGPYIAVGHSLGGYETLLFKDRNPQSVVGMVLVDPSIPDQRRRLAKAAPAFLAFGDRYMAQGVTTNDRCIAGLKSGKLRLGVPDPDGCLSYPPQYPSQLARVLATKDTNPLRLTAVNSLAKHFDSDGASMANSTRNYGNMPLIVLSATEVKMPPKTSLPEKDVAAFHAEFVRGHDEIAALSTRGENRLVPNATHYIQYDQPQAVIDAVDEVVRETRR